MFPVAVLRTCVDLTLPVFGDRPVDQRTSPAKRLGAFRRLDAASLQECCNPHAAAWTREDIGNR
jgi:hypothetical protein